ncbi:MAG: Glu-tRNA(Gln) amidotransferase subunit GatD [Candidatus Woesearchaeota archaeon]
MVQKVSPGDKVSLLTKDGKYTGILMPSPDDSIVVIKLNNGYNIGFEKHEIRQTMLVEKFSKKEVKKEPFEPKEGLKTVSILHTGGTIASSVDYATGAVTSKFSPEDIISMFPELKDIVNIRSRLIRNMASDDMRFAHYNIMAQEIEKEVNNGVDGVIITQGTDTMHYTAAALSFILEKLPVPVIVVGSQRSSDRGSSDAAMNLVCACRLIAESEFSEVAICMHKWMSDDSCTLIPGTNARKMHTSRRDAFKPINAEPWAEIGYGGSVRFLRGGYRKRSEGKIRVVPINESLKIGILKARPQMFSEELKVYEGFDGLVLEGTGLGHFPINEIDEFTSEHRRILAYIRKLARKMPVVMAPQTIYGRLQMDVYTPGRIIQEAGVIGNHSDMTVETTFVKLAWLLTNHKEKVKEMMMENLRGEISPRSEIGDSF